MMVAPLHPREAERLHALKALKILGTAAEREFDELTKLAAHICDAPIALITLINEDRQWFKSKVGTDLESSPRDIAFCAHTILQERVFVVGDLPGDERFRDNPLVNAGPKIRAYAGAVLRSPDHLPLGSLCVLDTQGRSFTTAQMDALQALANQVNRLLVLRANIEELEIANQRLEDARGLDEKRKLLERQLMIASKMSALGEMAAGVGHEINTPLTVIQLTVENMREQIEAGEVRPETLLKEVSLVEKTVTRISKIVMGLRTASRGHEMDPPQPTPLRDVISATVDLCEQRFRHQSVRLDLESPPELIIQCSPTQIAQVLVNLLNNAYDAVEKLPDRWVRLRATVENAIVSITVTDSGPGIPADIADRLTQPFFTTKSGKGTGLGLSISRTIAIEHGGDIVYDPTSPNTRFVLTLPLSGVRAEAA